MGKLELVRLLLESGADPKEAVSALAPAAGHGYLEIVKLLLERGAEVNPPHDVDFHQVPLIYAVDKGHVEVVKVLIENGADVNVKHNTLTPLNMVHNNASIAKLLRKAGATE